MSLTILNPESRGLIDNDVFKGQTLFSNGIPATGRLDSFGTVYVFNDDILYPKSFLGMHPHKNVEIITIMISGQESHKDTLGVHENYKAGDTQLISSGKGLYHEGGNVSDVENARHLQIWVAPHTVNLEPQVSVRKSVEKKTDWDLLVSPTGDQESLKINQQLWIYEAKLSLGEKIAYNAQSFGNGMIIYSINGKLKLNATTSLPEGGTAFITKEQSIELLSENNDAHFILIETIL